MRKSIVLSGALATAALAAAGLATLAQTEDDISPKAYYFAQVTGNQYWDVRADVEFNDYGEWFYVEDRKSDGWGAEAQYRLDSLDGRTRILDNNNGAGTERAFNLSFAEGRRVYFRACIQQGPEKKCGRWTTATA